MFRLRLSGPGIASAKARLERISVGWRDWVAPTLMEAREIMRAAVERALTGSGYEGHDWAPRSATSKKLRPDGGLGKLVSFIRDDVTQTTASLRLDFAAAQFLSTGGTTAAGSMIPGKSVPPRPLLMIPDAAAKRIAERQAEFFGRVVR